MTEPSFISIEEKRRKLITHFELLKGKNYFDSQDIQIFKLVMDYTISLINELFNKLSETPTLESINKQLEADKQGLLTQIKENEENQAEIMAKMSKVFNELAIMTGLASQVKQTKRTKPEGKCQWCGSEDGHWSSIYDWHCHKCGKVTID